MHLTATALLNVYPTTANHAVPLTASHINTMRLCAREDSAWAYRSAVISIVAALEAIEKGHRSWPVVQLYYSSFYSIRSILYSNNICIYFSKKKPVVIDLKLGECPKKLTFEGAGNSHLAATRIFREVFPSHPLNGLIDLEPALQWIRKLREIVNYNDSPMNLDDRLGIFRSVDRYGIRLNLRMILENLPLYAFLKEDAGLAFPIYAATLAKSSLSISSRSLIAGHIASSLSHLRDNSGPITALNNLQV